MTWFSLPTTSADNKAAFFDADSAASWLAAQPQANAAVMLAALVAQLEAFNGCCVAPRERFKTIEVLRATLLAVGADSQRRYEHKALPLLAPEQLAADRTRRLWRAAAQAYLHCLRACLEQEPTIVQHSAKVTHRALSCLRLEQLSCYVAGGEVDGDFWSLVHAVWAAAEQLGVARLPVADPQLLETRESTVCGQYGMALLLHLARPSSLSRRQLAALMCWFSRWREQLNVQSGPAVNPKSCAVALDLSSSTAVHDRRQPARIARWLVLDGVLRKMRERLQLLAKGESPESLKLGSGLSTAECQSLLTTLGEHLSHPLVDSPPAHGESIVLAAGLDNGYRLLGGARLKDEVAAPTSSFASQLAVEQLALFGHVVRETDRSSESNAEIWSLLSDDGNELQLVRQASDGGARLLLRGLLTIRLPPQPGCVLATVVGLCTRRDGSLWVRATRLAGTPTPLLAELREKPSGKISRHPALLLTPGPAPTGEAAPLVFLPAGLSGRALSIAFFDSRGRPLPALRLGDCVAHGGDSEGWSVVR